jgi:hypothetical protein
MNQPMGMNGLLKLAFLRIFHEQFNTCPPSLRITVYIKLETVYGRTTLQGCDMCIKGEYVVKTTY